MELAAQAPALDSLLVPVGGGGLLMGLTEYFRTPASGVHECPGSVSETTQFVPLPQGRSHTPLAMIGCEAYNYPTYAKFNHSRSKTIADGLVLEVPHAKVQKRIDELKIPIHLVQDADIRKAMRELCDTQGMLVEPSSAVTVAYVRENLQGLEEPMCLVLTGDNITREDFFALIGG